MSKIIYDVYKNTNEDSPSHGNFFGRIVHLETLNTRKLARHISEHGSVYTQDVVEGVLTKAEACIVEMLLESKKIKLEAAWSASTSSTPRERSRDYTSVSCLTARLTRS